MKKIIFLTLGFLVVILVTGCGKREKMEYVNLDDECNIGDAMVPQSELADYDCEELGGCEWKLLGGKKESWYACCPTDEKRREELNDLGEKIYLKCFRLVD